MLAAAKVGLSLVAAAGVTTAVVVTVSPEQPTRTEAAVTRHIDGDTFDVEIDGRPERVRLLNVDTPETKQPGKGVQCLGPEASKFLANMIPLGSPVHLDFDRKRRDRYGRMLAAVFTNEGEMVNAEVARAGFARVVTYDGNIRFRPPIETAWREATAARRGLHSLDVKCTIPAQVALMSQSVAQVSTVAETPADADSAGLRKAAKKAGAARRAASDLLQTLDGLRGQVAWTVLTPEIQTRLTRRAKAAREVAARAEKALRKAATLAAEEEEADRIARIQAARDEELRQAAAQEAREAEAPAVRRDSEAEAALPDEPSNEGNPTGYTGPRCYAPGGKTWRPC